jgi:hypothetical protein
MRQRLRTHLTYANVMVTILAFLVLGGATAFGAIVVSSNSQVAAGTISGHAPPAGKHSNIIAGSVNAIDLANGAVGPAKLRNNAVSSPKVAPNSLTGDDINEPTLGVVPNATHASSADNAFSRLVVGTSAVSASGYTLVASANGNNCTGARLRGRPDKNSFFNEFTFGPGTSGSLSGPTLLLNSTDAPAGAAVAGPGPNMWKVIVRSQDGSVGAVFEWTLDSNSGCHFAGEAIPSS